MPCVIPNGQFAAEANAYSASADQSSRAVLPGTARLVPERILLHLCCTLFDWLQLKTLPRNFSPSQTTDAFGAASLVRTKPDVIAVFSSTRLPGFSGRDFLTTTGSSATSHRVSAFLSCLLKSPTDPIPTSRDCRMMPGFPSYCAGSLLMITSSITCCRCP
jgi:hypothetical protein